MGGGFKTAEQQRRDGELAPKVAPDSGLLSPLGQSMVGGPKWTKMDLFRPTWIILVHFGLANAKIHSF